MIDFLKRFVRKVLNLFGYQITRHHPFAGEQILPPPPNLIPEKHWGKFTADGSIPVRYYYFDERRPNNVGFHNTKNQYLKVFKQLNKRKFVYYGEEIRSFYDALHKYPLAGKSVIIWGLAGCNCEAIAVWNNADKVYVVDYNVPVCDHKKIETLTHDEFLSRNIKTDAAFSYSSFEHDGLGRYGDPIDPDGDLKAMQIAHDALNEGGLMFLGVPLGRDVLCWNAHRIYGEIRLPLLLKGWQCLDVYDAYKNTISKSPFDLPIGKERQCLMILKKIVAAYPDDSVLLEQIGNENRSSDSFEGHTHSQEMLARICQIVLEYKTS
jgi:hypothetical protein